MSGSGYLIVFLMLFLLAIIADVLVLPLVLDYNSLLAKLGGCKTKTHVPWYARSDAKYNLDTLVPAINVGLAYATATAPASHTATATFDLTAVLAMMDKEKFEEADVVDGTVGVDGKSVAVTLVADADSPTGTPVEKTATVKLVDSTLILTVESTGFEVDANAALTSGWTIGYSVELQLGDSDNTVYISDGFDSA
jgi:hypothetical protein